MNREVDCFGSPSLLGSCVQNCRRGRCGLLRLIVAAILLVLVVAPWSTTAANINNGSTLMVNCTTTPLLYPIGPFSIGTHALLVDLNQYKNTTNQSGNASVLLAYNCSNTIINDAPTVLYLNSSSNNNQSNTSNTSNSSSYDEIITEIIFYSSAYREGGIWLVPHTRGHITVILNDDSAPTSTGASPHIHIVDAPGYQSAVNRNMSTTSSSSLSSSFALDIVLLQNVTLSPPYPLVSIAANMTSVVIQGGSPVNDNNTNNSIGVFSTPWSLKTTQEGQSCIEVAPTVIVSSMISVQGGHVTLFSGSNFLLSATGSAILGGLYVNASSFVGVGDGVGVWLARLTAGVGNATMTAQTIVTDSVIDLQERATFDILPSMIYFARKEKTYTALSKLRAENQQLLSRTMSRCWAVRAKKTTVVSGSEEVIQITNGWLSC